MDQTENTKVVEENNIPANENVTSEEVATKDGATESQSIVISESGGVAPNASAAAQKLIQSSERSDELLAKVSSDAISACKEIADKHADKYPEAITLAFDGIDKAVEAEKEVAVAKVKGRVIAVIGAAIAIVAGLFVAGKIDLGVQTPCLNSIGEDDQGESDNEMIDEYKVITI